MQVERAHFAIAQCSYENTKTYETTKNKDLHFVHSYNFVLYVSECRAVARYVSGERASNTLVTYHRDGNNFRKLELISNGLVIDLCS